MKKPTILCILDGWGWREEREYNAVRMASTPCFDRLWDHYPHNFLTTSGEAVGLPEGQMGNSEVGHLNLGAGRVVLQDLPRINKEIANHSLEKNQALQDFISTLKASKGACHLMGLMSPGGVHSHQDHAVALIKILEQAGIKVYVHAFTDGRDVPPQSGLSQVAAFEKAIGHSVATISGRYYAMDRDHRWERVKQAYDVLTKPSQFSVLTSAEIISASYAQNVTDEFILPQALKGYPGMHTGDGLLMFNFRADRARQILNAFVDPDFKGFEREQISFAAVLGMVEYSESLNHFMKAIFPTQSLECGLGQVLAEAGKTQMRMAETEKYPHVTFFFNGGEEAKYPGEDRVMIPSPKVATYDLKPEMSAVELTDALIAALEAGQHDFILINYANPDMVGHTGSLEAAIKAVQCVDTCLSRIVTFLEKNGGQMLVTADHGNCETMQDPITKEPFTSHTTNPVPLIYVGDRHIKLKAGILADIAPTLLYLMEMKQPIEMTGQNLVA